MTEAARLSVVVDANVGGAQRGLMGVQRSAAGAAKSMAKFAAVSAGLATVGAAVSGVVKTTVDFDKSMRNVNSIAQLNEGQFKKLSASVKDLAGPTAQAPKTLADGLYDLVSSGFNAKQSLTILKSSARAATAGLTDTATSTKAVAAVLNAYHRPASAAAAVSDDLFQTVNRGVLSFEDLAQNIGDVLPFASALGVNLKQVGAATATMTKAGVSAPETMTRIKSTMSALIKPSDDLKKAYTQLGVASGEELISKTGSLQGALQALQKTTGGNKEALSKLFPDIRALGGALLLTGTNAQTANADLQAFRHDSGATSTALKEQAKSVSFAWNQFKATMSAAAIDVGSGLVPAMASGAKSAADFIGEIRSGSGEGGKFAASVSQVAGTVASIVGPAASAALAVGKLGASLALTRSGLGMLAGAGTGFAAFKVAATVAPGVMKLGSAMSFLVMNARTAPSIGAFFASAGAAAGPVGIAAAAFVALGAAVGYALSRESADEAATRRNAAAKRDLAAAVDALAGKERSAVDAKNAAVAATDNVKSAEQRLRDVRKDPKASAQDRAQAEHALTQALTDSSRAHSEYGNVLARVSAAESQTQAKANDRLQAAGENLAKYKEQALQYGKLGNTGKRDDALRKEAAAQKEYNAAMREFGAANRVVSIADLQRQRIAGGQSAITAKNAAGYQFLAGVLQKMPASVKTRYLLDGDQAALSSIGQLSAQLMTVGKKRTVARILVEANSAKSAALAMKAILAGVPQKTVARILASTSGKQEVHQLEAAIGQVKSKPVKVTATTAGTDAVQRLRNIIDAVQGKSVSVGVTTTNTTINRTVGGGNHPRAAGRGPGQAETALVGEGNGPEWVGSKANGWKLVTAPTIMNLSARDSVIPTDPAYSARAAMIAQQAGFPGYAGGKTGAIDQTTIGVNPVTHNRERHTAKEWARIRAQAPVSQIQTGTNPNTHRRERHTAKEWARIRKDYKDAQDEKKKKAKARKDAAADRLSNPMSLVNLDVAAADVASAQLTTDPADDTQALAKQSRAIDARLKSVKHALSRKGLKRADRRRLLGEQASLLGQKGSMAPPAGFTGAQFAQSGVAQAALTPGLGDDVTAAKTLVDAFTADLKAAQATGDPTKIAEAATNLKGASDQLDTASQAVRDAATKVIDDKISAFGADVIKAKVGGNTGQELAALSGELATATEAFNAAVTASDIEGIQKYGGEVLSLRDDLKTLNDSIGSLTETMQAQLDLTKQALDEARRALNTSAAEQQAMGKYLVGIINQQVGQMVGRRSGTPRPLALSSY